MIVDEEYTDWGRESRYEKIEIKIELSMILKGEEENKKIGIWEKIRPGSRLCYMGRTLNGWVGNFINFYKDNGLFLTFLIFKENEN